MGLPKAQPLRALTSQLTNMFPAPYEALAQRFLTPARMRSHLPSAEPYAALHLHVALSGHMHQCVETCAAVALLHRVMRIAIST